MDSSQEMLASSMGLKDSYLQVGGRGSVISRENSSSEGRHGGVNGHVVLAEASSHHSKGGICLTVQLETAGEDEKLSLNSWKLRCIGGVCGRVTLWMLDYSINCFTYVWGRFI